MAGKGLTALVEIWWGFGLEAGDAYHVGLEFEDWGSADFYARLHKGGQVMVPVEIVGSVDLKGEMMMGHIRVSEEKR